MTDTDLQKIIESLIFVSDSPVDVKTIRKVVPEADAAEIRQALAALMDVHEAREGGFWLCEVAGGFQFRTRPEYKEYVKRLVQPAPVRLSKAALETLAIIAYHQPIIRSDIEHIRGVDSGAVVRNLLERKLIRVLGKKEIPGRPLIYGTTKRFLEVFNLRSLNDMPSLQEIEAFGSGLLAAEEGTIASAEEVDTAGETLEEGEPSSAEEAVEKTVLPETESEAAAEEASLSFSPEEASADAAVTAAVENSAPSSPAESSEGGPEADENAGDDPEENGT